MEFITFAKSDLLMHQIDPILDNKEGSKKPAGYSRTVCFSFLTDQMERFTAA